MFKKHYSRFLEAQKNQIHFACHSHHYWPDVSRDAHIQYWDDSAKYVDNKWEFFFSTAIPQAQQHIARNLNLTHTERLVFAPNTHELLFRLLTSLNWEKPVHILTTDSEFYSFDRQINRLSELPRFTVEKVPTYPLETFEDRFQQKLQENKYDMVFFSHVFFNSGFVCDIHKISKAIPKDSLAVIDGYHGFMAVPTDLKSLEDSIFYLAGSYKYAQGGEGGCFLYVPPKTQHRPLYTGWFAELAHLNNVQGKTQYPSSAMQYAGSTMDFSALYRLNAVLALFEKENITVPVIHQHIQNLQNLFLEKMNNGANKFINRANLLKSLNGEHGHFLTFELSSVEDTQKIVQELNAQGIHVDSRGSRVRFGFGLYLDESDINQVCAQLF